MLGMCLGDCTMPDAWDFYFANVNEVAASLFVDLGIRDSIPDTERRSFGGNKRV